jgi:TonB family protein
MNKKINSAILVTALALSAVAAAEGPAATPVPTSAESTAGVTEAAGAPVQVEVFKGPRSKRVKPPAYPSIEQANGRDGWVALNFMIDPQGKPYEITIMESTGNEALEQAALKAARDWEFEPATLNGVPIDAGHALKVNFRLSGESGANTSFVRAYREFNAAITAQDRAKADAAMAKLEVRNLYEDAFYGLAQYHYARLWGTKDQERIALKRAIASEDDANFLPKDTFRATLESLLPLQILQHDFAGALATWSKLEKRANAETKARWKESINRIEALRTDSSPYTVAGDFADSPLWGFPLFRNRFHIAVASGRIAEIKLRCDKKYVFFKYDPEVEYTVSRNYGACGMELVGDPGTKFTLTQS